MKNTNQSGFSVIESLLILVVVGILGFTGWYVYHSQQAASKNYSAAGNSMAPTYKKRTPAKSGATSISRASSVQNPSAGWKTGTLSYEKVTYQYPADWTVTDSSSSTPKGTGCVYPGMDNVVLTSPSNHQVTLNTGVACIGGTAAKTFGSISITALGKDLYITLADTDMSGMGGSTPTGPTSACLSPTATQSGYPTGLKSKNIFMNGSAAMPYNEFCYWPYLFNSSNANPPRLTAQQMESSADFMAAKQIFESMKYATN